MKIIDSEHQREIRTNWLSEYGLENKDVMRDEDGFEYIMKEPAIMDEGENESYDYKKVYLPQDLDLDNPPF